MAARHVALIAATVVVSTSVGRVARAEDRFVGGVGDPYSDVQSAIADADSGDAVVIRPGTYPGPIQTSADGITIRGDGTGEVVIQSSGRVLEIAHAGVTIEAVVLDGMFGATDAVRIEDGADGATLRRVEVRRSGRDCIDMGAPSGVTIEQSLVHHCLWSTRAGCDAPDCREDAHGIVGGAVRDLVIRDTEVHTFSGDAVQVDPGRDPAGWSGLVIERAHFWLAPLPEAIGGYAAGVVPGENALDTKTPPEVSAPSVVTIRDSIFHGFGGGLITNMAALNLKENVLVTVDRTTVYDCEIAFRVRGATSTTPRGAQVTIANAVIYGVSAAGVRYEDDIAPVHLWNVTFGAGVARGFVRASAPEGAIDARNVLVLGGALPPEAAGASNLAVGAEVFVGAAMHDYHLAAGSSPIDAGETIAEVTTDRDGQPRPAGTAYDVGAYEHCETGCVEPPDGGVGGDGGGVVPRTDGGARADGGGDGGTGASEDGGCGCGVPSARGARSSAWLAIAAVLGAIVLARRRAITRR